MNYKKVKNNLVKQLKKPLTYCYHSIPDIKKYGRDFQKQYKLLEDSQWWSRKQQDNFQLEELKKILTHAYLTVPYYKKLFDLHGIIPANILDFNDIKKIPYLTKDIIKENFNDLISSDYKKRNLVKMSTGGSTGEPLIFLADKKEDRIKEWAFVSHLWSRVGYNVRGLNKRVILMGSKPTNNSFYEYKNRDLILSSYQLTRKNIRNYVNLLEKFNPDFIHCYPSSILLIANYIKENNITIKIPKLKAILCVSENLRDEQREIISSAFQQRVYSFYGHSEHAAIAGECEKSKFYHIEPFYGYTEIIGSEDQKVTEEGERGEIISTSFLNYAMPLIRYKTNDIAIISSNVCECGRNHQLIKKLEGREQEYFITKDKEKVMLTGSYKLLSNIQDKIYMGQFYQDSPGKVLLKIIPKTTLSDEDQSDILKKFSSTYKSQLELKIKVVDQLERTSRGKFKFLVQNIKFL